MTPEEKLLVDSVVGEVKTLITENNKGLISDKELENKVTPIIQKLMDGTVTKEQFEKLQGEFNDMGLAIKAREEQVRKSSIVSFEDALTEAFKGQQAHFSEMINDRNKTFKYRFNEVGMRAKCVGTMLNSTVSGTPFVVGMEPGLIWPGDTQPEIINRCNVKPTNSYLIWYVQKTSREGGPGFQTEGSAKSQLDFVFAQSSSTPDTVAGYVKVSKQQLNDVQECQNEIQGEVSYQVNYKADLLVKDGAGVAITNGLTDIGAAISLTTTTFPVLEPNLIDCIFAGIAQISASNFKPNKVFLNPIDYYQAMVEKDLDGSPVSGDYMSFQSLFPTIEIVPTNMVTQGYILMGDFTKAQVRILEGFNVSIGYSGTDFIDNVVTILGEMRLHFWVPSNHSAAFLYDAIADIKTAIGTV